LNSSFLIFVLALIAHFSCYSYDGTLVCCAIHTFIWDHSSEPSVSSHYAGLIPFMFATSFLAGIIRKTCSNMSRLPPLTASFNLVMVLLLVSLARGTFNHAHVRWPAPNISLNHNDTALSSLPPPPLHLPSPYLGPQYLFRSTLLGIGQFMFVSDQRGAVLVLLGIFLSSPSSACMAVLGSAVGTLSSLYLMHSPLSAYSDIGNGLYSYNSMGAAVAIGGGIFFESSFSACCIGTLAAIVTTFVSAGLQAIFMIDNHHLPIMTLPFIVTTWIFLLTRSEWLVPLSLSGENDLGIAHNALSIFDATQRVMAKGLIPEQQAEGWIELDTDIDRGGEGDEERRMLLQQGLSLHVNETSGGLLSDDYGSIEPRWEGRGGLINVPSDEDVLRSAEALYECTDDQAWYRRKSKIIPQISEQIMRRQGLDALRRNGRWKRGVQRERGGEAEIELERV
jgi:urea transporter